MAEKLRIMEPETKLHRIMRKIFLKRNVKDNMFCAVFAEKKYQLELYNALNNSNYVNESDIIAYTMEDVIYLKMKNDLSFLVGNVLNLYEHQSSYNPNMPLRGLIYFARQYEDYVNEQKADIYGKKLIKLPVPQFIVFYNGTAEIGKEKNLSLSDAYIQEPDGYKEPALECRAKVININYGRNQELMAKSSRLQQYSRFIELIRQYKQTEKTMQDAIKKAIDQGIEENLLSDVLIREKSEVYHMLLTEYNEKLHIKNTREEGRLEGIREGIRQQSIETMAAEKRAEDAEAELARVRRELEELKKNMEE